MKSRCPMICSTVLCITTVFAFIHSVSDVTAMKSTGGGNLGEDVYKIYYHEPGVSADNIMELNLLPGLAGGSSQQAEDEDSPRWMPMKLANGSKYRCLLPLKKDASSFSGTEEEQQRQLREEGRFKNGEAIPRIRREQIEADVLKDSRGNGLCVSKAAGWWVYEVCWGKHVRQFHMSEKNTVETEYILGLGAEANIEDGASGKLYGGENNLHGHFLSTSHHNGTVCDLSGQQRSSVIRLVCKEAATEGSAFQLEVAETETCKYTMTIHSRAACEIPELAKVQVHTASIHCFRQADRSSIRGGAEELDGFSEMDGETVPIDLGL